MKKAIYLLSVIFLLSQPRLLHAQGWSRLGGGNGLNAGGEIMSICSDPMGNIYASGILPVVGVVTDPLFAQ